MLFKKAMLLGLLALFVFTGCAASNNPASTSDNGQIPRFDDDSVQIPVSEAKDLTNEEIVKKLWSMYLEQLERLSPQNTMKIKKYEVTHVVNQGGEMVFQIDFTVVPYHDQAAMENGGVPRKNWPKLPAGMTYRKNRIKLVKQGGLYKLEKAIVKMQFDEFDEYVQIPVNEAKGLTTEEIAKRLWSIYLEQHKALTVREDSRLIDYKIEGVKAEAVNGGIVYRVDYAVHLYQGRLVNSGNDGLVHMKYFLRVVQEADRYQLEVLGTEKFKAFQHYINIPVSEVRDLPETEIMKRLWSLYLNEFKAPSVEEYGRLLDYRIENIEEVNTDGEIMFFVTFSVHPYTERWVAGTARDERDGTNYFGRTVETYWAQENGGGKCQEDGWIANKVLFVRLVKQKDLYKMEIWGNGYEEG